MVLMCTRNRERSMKKTSSVVLIFVLSVLLYLLPLYLVDIGSDFDIINLVIVLLLLAMPVLVGLMEVILCRKVIKQKVFCLIIIIANNVLSVFISLNVLTLLTRGRYFLFDSEKVFAPIIIFIYCTIASTCAAMYFYLVKKSKVAKDVKE